MQKLSKPLLNSLLLTSLLLTAPMSYAATKITATLQDPAEGVSDSFYGDITAYRWNSDGRYWEWANSRSTNSNGNVSFNLSKGKYYFETSMYGSVDGVSISDSEYYDNTKDFDSKVVVNLRVTDTEYDLGIIDFEYSLPPLAISEVKFAQRSSQIPSEGGLVKSRVRVMNTTEQDYSAIVWGIVSHYVGDDSAYVTHPISNPKRVNLSPGLNTVIMNFAVPAEAPNYFDLQYYVGGSYYSSDVTNSYAYIYKDSAVARTSASIETQANEPTKRRIPKTVSEDGTVLSWK